MLIIEIWTNANNMIINKNKSGLMPINFKTEEYTLDGYPVV